MNNKITNWSWDKPMKAGYYLVCYGDVETEANTSLIKLEDNLYDGQLWDKSSETNISEYSDSYKFARLVIGSDE